MRKGRASLAAVFLGFFAAVAAPAAAQDTLAVDTPAVAAPAAPQPTGPLTLTIDLSERTLHVQRGGETVKSYPVAVGKPEHPTPTGGFVIRRIVWNPSWVPPAAAWARNRRPRAAGDPRNPMGRVKMFFRSPDYYIHGTNDEDSLGQAESHGCVRMRNADVIELARLVMEHGGEPRSPGWFQQVVNRVRSTREVRLSAPVQVRIVE